MTPDEQLFQIFHPQLLPRHKTAASNEFRFVHYTNAEAAMSILRNKEVWMKKASCMNDYTEVQYGLFHLNTVYNGQNSGLKFKNALEGIFPGFCKSIEDVFNPWQKILPEHTYLACISKYDDKNNKANGLGRLSMWRAYGKTTGIALVMDGEQLLGPPDPDAIKGVHIVPVDYRDGKEFEEWFGTIADNINANVDLIRGLGKEMLTRWIFRMFMFAAISSKHPGFIEEDEWRIVYSPKVEPSEDLIKAIEQMPNGEPQPLYKIPLRHIPKLVNSIIIGPTPYPEAIWEAFVDLLGEAGVENPASKVFISYIPLRR